MRDRRQQRIDSTGSQRGVSLLEVSIVSVMFVISLGIFYAAAISVSDMAVDGNRQSRIRTQQNDVLGLIRRELESTGKQGRFEIAPDQKSITYQKLIGATQSGADVSGVWSPSFRIELDLNGQVVRREQGKTVSWGSGIELLEFHQSKGEDFITVLCETLHHGESVVRKIHIFPKY